MHRPVSPVAVTTPPAIWHEPVTESTVASNEVDEAETANVFPFCKVVAFKVAESKLSV